MSKLYNVGVYIRLSMEDAAYDSDSIENQREMLSLFIDQMPGWVLHKNYVDNGYSGGNFHRPGFLEMMQDVRGGKVNLVLVKDLSRFGRNYLEAGRYLEEELPALGCRFVALSDGIDTENGETDIMPFLNAMNDYYIKNLSDRIRSVIHAKMRDGQKWGRISYGYCRDPQNHAHLVIDEETAAVVRRLFQMRRSGMGIYNIVKTLNAEGIMSPMVYRQSHQLEKESRSPHKKWIQCTIRKMLRDEIYIGTAAQRKNKMASYRERREVRCPPEDWLRVENAFPPIIDRETWDAVQEVNRQASEDNPQYQTSKRNLFTSLVTCQDCGKTMTASRSYYTNQDGQKLVNLYYHCRTFSVTAGSSCTSHAISELELKELVLGAVHQFAAQISLDENAMLKSLTGRLISTSSISKAGAQKEVRRLRQELRKLEAAMSTLYEDWAGGTLTEGTFSQRMEQYETQRQANEQRLTLWEQTEQQALEKQADIERRIELIRANANATDIDRDLLESLVEKIEVGACGPQREVQIHYRFVGNL